MYSGHITWAIINIESQNYQAVFVQTLFQHARVRPRCRNIKELTLANGSLWNSKQHIKE